MKPLPHAGAQTDQILHPVGGQERIAEDLLGLLPDAVDTTGPLDEPDNGPGQIEVHDDRAVLEVLAFAQHICRYEDAKLLLGPKPVALVVALGAEPPRVLSRIIRVAGDACETP